jgi:hypothetical protein
MTSIHFLPDAALVFYTSIIPGSAVSGTKLDTAYIEFVNGNAIEPPDIDPAQIKDYFTLLGEAVDRDYLRVPIISHTLTRGDNNLPTKLTLVIGTQGETGAHGKPFSAAVGSRVYGVTLAASQINDREDLLVANGYYSPEQQMVKPETGEIMLTVNLIQGIT